MQIAILGPLEVRDGDGRVVEVAGTRLRTLLTRLALDAGRPVSVTALVDAVWAQRPPAEATNALQTLVSRLRRALGATSAIGQSPAGYRLDATADEVDARRFEALAAEGASAVRDGESARAATVLSEALGLWRGPALVDSRTYADVLDFYAARLDDLRLGAIVDLAEAELAGGQQPDVAKLERLSAEHPLHERLAAQLVRALASAGRQAEALSAYETVRIRLADELGVDPSAELQELHLSLLRAAEARPERTVRRSNLKAQLTSFVGRDDEVSRIGKSLESNRLVTLVGPGGAGKTRLAGEAAARVIDTAHDGIWLTELATVTSGADVAQAVLGSLGMREIHLMERRATTGARDALSRLLEGLAESRAVLILDNCEHVIDAAAHLAESLLGECPGLRVLTTSREPLGIVGETLLAVPPLGQPAPSASSADALDFPAVRLFADRAASVRPEFAIDDVTVGPVIEIVRRLDGLPLAIELAAARLRTLPLDEISARLTDRFRLLTGGSRTALPRHRTLRAVVEWSWDLLTDDERALVERLAVFSSGVTLASATAVRPDNLTGDDVADLLASLIDKSLLQPIGDGRRMRMLETIREFGIERLAERGELANVRTVNAEYFADLLKTAAPYLTTSEQLPWFDVLRIERENILAAMRFRADTGDADGALTVALSLGGYSMMLGDHSEISDWVAYALAVPGGTDRELRLMGRALHALNSTAAGSEAGAMPVIEQLAVEMRTVPVSTDPFLGLLRPAAAFVAGMADLSAELAADTIAAGGPWARAAARMFLANMAENRGDIPEMRRYTDLAMAEFRELGERWGMASTLRSLGQLRTLDGDLDGARAAYEEALGLMVEMQSNDDLVFLNGGLADIAGRAGDLDAARRYAAAAQASCDERPVSIEAVAALTIIAEIEWLTGDIDTARARQAEASHRLGQLSIEHPMRAHVRAIVLAGEARVAVADGRLDAAADILAAAAVTAMGTNDLPIVALVGIRRADLAVARGEDLLGAEILGASAAVRGADDPTSVDLRTLAARIIERIGAEAYAAAYARGRTLDRAAALALLNG